MLLELELTESLMVEDAPSPIATLQHLKSLGVSISIDDFGTGYSSLSYLAQYPFDTLKIDRCFISNIAHGSTNAAIVKAIIEMAKKIFSGATSAIQCKDIFSLLLCLQRLLNSCWWQANRIAVKSIFVL